MEKENIRLRLKSIGQDRYWLANKMGVTKRGIDSWLSSSRPIPKTAERMTSQLIKQYPDSDDEGKSKGYNSLALTLIPRFLISGMLQQAERGS